MSARQEKAGAGIDGVLDRDEVEGILRQTFFHAPASAKRTPGPRKVKPDHYEVICISLYREDLERLDAKVAQLKERGHRKMSRSALIRFALDNADLDKLPKSY